MTTGLATEEDEWSQFTLGDLCSLITDGKHGDSEDQSHSGFYFLSVKDILGNRLVYENARQITEVDFSETNRRTNLQPGDVLFTNTGTIGRIAIAGDDPRTYRTTFQKSVAILKPRRDLIDPRFLYYLLHFDNANLSEFAAGTTQKNLLLKDIRSFEVKVPPLREQHAIAHILGTLDDKIELNRRMNQTLEAMARAIFQDWFVDFGPVRAKIEGQDPYLPPELWDLFADDLVDSELGEIPEGWEVRALDDIADYQNGLALQRFRPGDNEERLPAVKIAQLRTGKADAGEWARATIRPECIIDNGDVIFSWSGSLMVKVWYGGRAALNQHLFKVTSKGYPRWFYLQRIESHLSDFQSIAADKTTTMGHIKREHLSSAKCVVPDQTFLKAVDEILGPLFTKQISVNLCSNALESQRDTLLPKLISGEIEVG